MLSHFLLSRASGTNLLLRSGPYFGCKRGIATQFPFTYLPPPAPREFNADGTPKKYRLNQYYFDHKYDWERWCLRPVGVFHTVYQGEFAKDYPPFQAWLFQHNGVVVAVPTFFLVLGLAFVLNSASYVGIKPKRFCKEWMEASKERDRAENSNPLTRYLDRRRKERGPNWLAEDYFPTHPFVSMNKQTSDKEFPTK